MSSILARYGVMAPPSPERKVVTKGRPVSDSEELRRVIELPSRERPTSEELSEAAAWLKEKLGVERPDCACVEHFKRLCCKDLRPVQTWALVEGASVGGVLGPIGVGHGKTLLDLLMAMVVPDCRVAVLLLPPSLKAQLLEVDWRFYSQHWKLPNLAGGKWLTPGRPLLHVVAFSELSGSKNSDLLSRIKPDTLIIDEAQSVAQPTAARTKRLMRYLREHPEVRVFCWSGTLTKRSLRDYGHLASASLKDGSPLPRTWMALEEWASALDPAVIQSPPGALVKLTKPGELVRDAFRRRSNETAGVINSASDDSCESSLVISQRMLDAPPTIRDMIKKLENDWNRPDDEPLVDILQVAACARELACGFFYRWIWPRGESKAVRDAWLEARKAWASELREKLKRAGEGLDSPKLLEDAARRFHKARDIAKTEIDMPRWDSECWPRWDEVRDTALPSTEAVWIDDYLVKDAASWLQEEIGICWYEHTAFGKAVEKASRMPRFGAGRDASSDILREDGRRSMVCSILAHGTGKNLQMFKRNLVANPPSDGAAWEQLLGRTHRQGQLADEVLVDVYRHTAALAKAVDKARDLADYIQGVLGAPQKLVAKADWRF